MLLNSEISAQPYKSDFHHYQSFETKTSPIMNLFWLNLIEHQKLEVKPDKLTNYYNVLQDHNKGQYNLVIDMKEFCETQAHLLSNKDLSAIHGMVTDFVNLCGKLIQKQSDNVLRSQQQTLEYHKEMGADTNNQYLIDAVIPPRDNNHIMRASITLKK